jgi:hypothetical protein
VLWPEYFEWLKTKLENLFAGFAHRLQTIDPTTRIMEAGEPEQFDTARREEKSLHLYLPFARSLRPRSRAARVMTVIPSEAEESPRSDATRVALEPTPV